MTDNHVQDIIGVKGDAASGKSGFIAALVEALTPSSNYLRYELGEEVIKVANFALATSRIDGSERVIPFALRRNIIDGARRILEQPTLPYLVPTQLAHTCDRPHAQTGPCLEHLLEEWITDFRDQTIPVITASNKARHQRLLSYIGANVRQQAGDNGIWIRSLGRKLATGHGRTYPLVVVGGLRDPEEVQVLRSLASVTTKVWVIEVVGTAGGKPSTDLSSIQFARMVTDSYILNTSREHSLRQVASQVARDMKRGGPLRLRYSPSHYGPS